MEEKTINCDRITCSHCAESGQLGFDFTMAFQPIVNCTTRTVWGYEALVRGLNNESAYSIISQINEKNRYIFDQLCRTKAIALASKLGINSILSINFLPNAIYQPERCIRTTLEAARRYNFPLDKILFEFTEVDRIEDSKHVKRIVNYYQSLGFQTAIDDFGSGYSGLNLLADFQTNIIKLDMELIRNIHSDKARQSIITHCLAMFHDLNIIPLAEGIECHDEYIWLKNAGIELMQGYLFSKPGFERLPDVNFPSD